VRLIDLEPRWYTLEDRDVRVGFSFDCPHCTLVRLGVAVHDKGHRVLGAAKEVTHPPAEGRVWEITAGNSFQDISLQPSIDASQVGHWHGHITNGEVT
jgi:hypothetical protein